MLICNLDPKKCVGDSFDGAANMSGEYEGVSAHLKKENMNHLHTWCYAHALNVVISESTEIAVPAISLFGLVQELGVFFRESYKRMIAYEKTNAHVRLSIIGKTRWTSKSEASAKIFGKFRTWKNMDTGDKLSECS